MDDVVKSAISARKRPTQERSRQMVERILEATRELLRQTSGGATAKVTTNRIAKQAGISVGSLYQYFPNTEAVLYEVYREFLDQVRQLLGEFDSAEYLAMSREEFFDRLIREVTRTEPDRDVVLAMRGATKIYPELAEVDRQHAEWVAKAIAKFLKYYGSSWPMEKLQRLGLYAYYLDEGTWTYRDHAGPPVDEVHDWEAGVFKFMIDQCFD